MRATIILAFLASLLALPGCSANDAGGSGSLTPYIHGQTAIGGGGVWR